MIPLDLTAEIVDSDNTRYRWAPSEPAAANRLRNLSFSTKLGEGFSSATGQLARRIDLDYADLSLVDTVSFIGADGSIAWEGRISAMPRQLDDTHSVSVTLTGWMAHAKDRKFTEIYVDRDLNSWQNPSVRRRASLYGLSYSPTGMSVIQDPTTNEAAIQGMLEGSWIAPYRPLADAWYDAGPTNFVKAVSFGWQRGNTNVGTTAPFDWRVQITDDDVPTTVVQDTGNLVGAGPAAVSTLENPTGRRFANMQFSYSGTPAGGDGLQYPLYWKKVAVYGAHGAPRVTGDPSEPAGVFASDVVRDVAGRFCPQLRLDGVLNTSFVIPHLAFKDPVFPYDAFLDVNKYHLWNLGVWENRTLFFEPHDLTDYDWEIRTDDPGTTFAPQGPSIDDTFNGICVNYTDILKGTKERLTPDVYSELLSTDPTNPWNEHKVQHWDEIDLSTPTLQAQALQLGRAALADRNTPKTPGTITVQGYVRDRQGVKQPVWKVRAGDTIAVTNFPNDSPRLIVETDYDDERKQISLSIDRPFALLEAYIDRASTAIAARNLSG